MRYLKSENTTPLNQMELGKVRLTVNGQDTENIWIKRDSDKCYLQNHALNLYPYPSWGLELPYSSNIDIAELRGETPEDGILVLHPEAFSNIEKYLDEEGVFDYEKFEEDSKKPKSNEQ